MKNYIYFISSTSFLISCSIPKYKQAEAIRLNDEALNIMLNADMGSDSSEANHLYIKSLSLLKDAVDMDSTNRIIIANKARLEFKPRDYNNAIITIERYNKHNKINSELKFFCGIYYLKLGKDGIARQILTEVSDEYISLKDSANFYFVRSFIDDRVCILNQIDTIQSLRLTKELIKTIDYNNIDQIFE